jgi:hypothetical protein
MCVCWWGAGVQVLSKVLPRFLSKCPHPATFAGMLEMSVCYLPVNDGWPQYIARAEATHDALATALATRLRQLTDAALAAGPDTSKVRSVCICACVCVCVCVRRPFLCVRLRGSCVSLTVRLTLHDCAEPRLYLSLTLSLSHSLTLCTQTDPWLRHLDWTIDPIRYTRPKYKKDGTFAKGGEPRPVAHQRLPGFPAWYKGTHA